jgi:hypothetical protein
MRHVMLHFKQHDYWKLTEMRKLECKFKKLVAKKELLMSLSLEVCLVVTIKGHVGRFGVDDKKSSPQIV